MPAYTNFISDVYKSYRVEKIVLATSPDIFTNYQLDYALEISMR